MGASKTRITNYLEMRFDYLSARNIITNWSKEIGLRDEPEEFDDSLLKSLLAYLKENEAGAKRVHDAIERLILVGGNDVVHYAEPAYAEPEPAYAEPEPAYAEPEPAYAEPEPVYEQPVEAEPAYDQYDQFAAENYADPSAEPVAEDLYAAPVDDMYMADSFDAPVSDTPAFEIPAEEVPAEISQESNEDASAENNGGKKRKSKKQQH